MSSEEFASNGLLTRNFSASAASVEIGMREAKVSERDRGVIREYVTDFQVGITRD